MLSLPVLKRNQAHVAQHVRGLANEQRTFNERNREGCVLSHGGAASGARMDLAWTRLRSGSTGDAPQYAHYVFALKSGTKRTHISLSEWSRAVRMCGRGAVERTVTAHACRGVDTAVLLGPTLGCHSHPTLVRARLWIAERPAILCREAAGQGSSGGRIGFSGRLAIATALRVCRSPRS